MVSHAINANDLSYTFQISKSLGGGVHALHNFNLEIQEGEVVSIFGPNGCGKSTLIRICAGLLPPTKGSVLIGGLSPNEAKVGYIPQKFSESLFPWLTNLDNIAFPLYVNGMSRLLAREKANYTAERVSASFSLNRYPFEMSIGQQQKIALARALVVSPKVLLADEPFSALDFQARVDLHAVFQNVLNPDLKVGALLVSHNVEDAVFLSDRVMVTSPLPMTMLKIFHVPVPRPRDPAFKKSEQFFNLVTTITDEFLRGSTK